MIGVWDTVQSFVSCTNFKSKRNFIAFYWCYILCIIKNVVKMSKSFINTLFK